MTEHADGEKVKEGIREIIEEEHTDGVFYPQGLRKSPDTIYDQYMKPLEEKIKTLIENAFDRKREYVASLAEVKKWKDIAHEGDKSFRKGTAVIQGKIKILEEECQRWLQLDIKNRFIIDKLQAKIATLKEKLESREGQITRAIEMCTHSAQEDTHKSVLEMQISNKNGAIEELELEIATLKERVKAGNECIDVELDKNKKLKAKVAELQKDLLMQKEDASYLLRKQISTLEAKVKELESGFYGRACARFQARLVEARKVIELVMEDWEYSGVSRKALDDHTEKTTTVYNNAKQFLEGKP